MLLGANRTAPKPAPSTTPRFHYCNLCYDTAALVVERVTGRTFEEALRARLFAPLDIDRAFVRPARLADMPADRAVGFRTAGGRTERFDAEDLEGFHGGGNLYASARDFARFARAFAIEAPVPGADVVKRALLPAKLAADATSGLTLGSWYCAADAQRCHYRGAHRGFHNVMYWDRAKRLVVVYVSNSTLAPWLQPRIARELVAAAEGREPAWLGEPALQALTPEVLARAAGSYDVAGVGRVALRAVGETAFARPPGGVEYPLYAVSSTLLYAPGLDAYVGLSPDGRLAWTTLYVDALGARAKR
jgi:CubicO group peptidase (beta-lactamase class C family)